MGKLDPDIARGIAEKALKLAMSVPPETDLGHGLMAMELAALTVGHITSGCPSCGSEPWVNIDCELCVSMQLFTSMDMFSEDSD